MKWFQTKMYQSDSVHGAIFALASKHMPSNMHVLTIHTNILTDSNTLKGMCLQNYIYGEIYIMFTVIFKELSSYIIKKVVG